MVSKAVTYCTVQQPSTIIYYLSIRICKDFDKGFRTTDLFVFDACPQLSLMTCLLICVLFRESLKDEFIMFQGELFSILLD